MAPLAFEVHYSGFSSYFPSPKDSTMSNLTNGFSQGTVLAVGYGMLAVTSTVILVRVGLNFRIPKKLTVADYLLFLAFALHVAMCTLYIIASPYMEKVYGVANGTIPPYPDVKHDMGIMVKLIFSSFCLFWMALWSVKFSLLFLYRKLLVGISTRYTVVWWCTIGLCVAVSNTAEFIVPLCFI
jgi:hypothetical protein